MSEWINIKDQLPDEFKNVIVAVKSGDKYQMYISYRFDFNRWNNLGRINVSYWMPLPEQPKEEIINEENSG